MARYGTLDEIRNASLSGVNNVRLGEVASVVHGVPERRTFQRINGKKAISFEVYQESGANIVEVCRQVEELLKEIEANPRTSNFQFEIFATQGQFIQDSVGNLRNTGLWGGLFAALVLLYYLRTIRMTTIITLAIPLSIMITISALYFIGWSLNILTMMGLMVGVGMVVDNAIVVLENIYRFRARGRSARNAAIEGASEVGLAITMATLTDRRRFSSPDPAERRRAGDLLPLPNGNPRHCIPSGLSLHCPHLHPDRIPALWRRGPNIRPIGYRTREGRVYTRAIVDNVSPPRRLVDHAFLAHVNRNPCIRPEGRW
jgi:hypothetical protein